MLLYQRKLTAGCSSSSGILITSSHLCEHPQAHAHKYTCSCTLIKKYFVKVKNLTEKETWLLEGLAYCGKEVSAAD